MGGTGRSGSLHRSATAITCRRFIINNIKIIFNIMIIRIVKQALSAGTCVTGRNIAITQPNISR
jgi:hypothetical protein